MKEPSTKLNTRASTNAKAPEVTTAIRKKITKTVFDGVAMPSLDRAKQPIERPKTVEVSRAPKEKVARVVPSLKQVEFEKSLLDEDDDSDTDDEDGLEIDRQILAHRKTIREDPPHLLEPTVNASSVPVPASRPAPAAVTRPMDHVRPRVVEPIPRNQSREAEIATKLGKSYKLLSELHKEGLDEQIAKLIFENKLEISTSDLLALAPGVKKIMLRKAKNQRVKPRQQTSAQVFNVNTEGQETEELKSCRILSKYIHVGDLYQGDDDMFEILTVDREGMPAGSIVQKDIVESFMNDMSDTDDRRGLVIVANKGNGLRTVYPSINGSEPDIENILDSGSQIVAIDRCIAIGLEISWDPTITVRMEDVHGGLASTLGLAKNVPFKFGEITVYLQCHVQNKAPFEVLLGRPFDVLTESEVRTFGNGDTEITIKDPNSSRRVTIGTFPRGQKAKQARIDQSRYITEPALVPEQPVESAPKETEVNFHASTI